MYVFLLFSSCSGFQHITADPHMANHNWYLPKSHHFVAIAIASRSQDGRVKTVAAEPLGFIMWVEQCHKPPMTSWEWWTYQLSKICDELGYGAFWHCYKPHYNPSPSLMKLVRICQIQQRAFRRSVQGQSASELVSRQIETRPQHAV